MPVADQASFLSTCTLHHVELKMVNRLIIKILRKIVAIFKENRYHCLVVYVRVLPFVYGERQDRLGKVCILSFSMVYGIKDNIKSSDIKECDRKNVRFFDAGALIILLEIGWFWETRNCGITKMLIIKTKM